MKQSRMLLVVLVVLLSLGICVTVLSLSLSHSRPTRIVPDSSVSELKEQFAQSIQSEGAEKAYRDFKESYRSEQFDIAHNAAHLFGEALYTTLGLPGVRMCDADMNFGCFHGFFSKAVRSEGLSTVKGLDDACFSEPEGALACQHGIGHGILEFMGTSHLVDALNACLEARRTDPIAGCTSGVFMEYNVPLVTSEDGSFDLATRPLTDENKSYDPCPSLPKTFRLSCYHELPQWWYQVLNRDFSRMGKLCTALSDLSEQSACTEGIGNIVISSAEYEVREARRLCELLPTEKTRSQCIVTASWSFVTNVNDVEHGLELCRSALPSDQPRCPTKP